MTLSPSSPTFTAPAQVQRHSTLDRLWKWIPEKIVQSVPILTRLRGESARRHADAASHAVDAETIDVAIAEYTTALELEPWNPKYLYGLGRIYYQQNDLNMAEVFFRRALAADFYNADAVKGLGYTLHRQNKTDEAIYLYLRYLERQPKDLDVHLNLIAALEAGGKYEEAIRAGERAVEEFPSDAQLLFMLARNNYLAGKIDVAIPQLEQAHDLNPENSDIYRVLGVALRTRGDFDLALKNFREAIKHNPSDADAYLAAADAYQRLGRDEEYLQAAQTARQLFEAAKNDMGVKYACWDEGWAHYKLRHWADSVKASECALKIDSSLASVRFNLALALLRLGEVERARREYESAMELNDLGSLKSAGIDDLTAAVNEEPQLAGAQEIIKQLERK